MVLLFIEAIILIFFPPPWGVKKNDADEEKTEEPGNPGDYEADPDDENLKYNLLNSELAIRVYKSYANKKKSDPDKLVFATSIMHKFDDKAKQLMLAEIGQLVDIDFSESHELLITKSGSSKFIDLEDAILKYIFSHLYQEYAWQLQRQEINAWDVMNVNLLKFSMREETHKHLALGYMLNNIKGISSITIGAFISKNESCGYPVDGKPGVYDFVLAKAFSYSWEELIPEIKKVFVDYFPGGVNFSGRLK